MLAEKIYRGLKLRLWIQRQGRERFEWIRAAEELVWRHDRQAFRELARLARFDWGAAWEPDSWNAIDLQLERLERLSEKWSFQVALVVFPVAFQAQATFLEDEPQREILRRASTRAWPALDLLPRVRASDSEMRFYYDQYHPTPEGNDVLGRAVADFLYDALLTDLHGAAPPAEVPWSYAVGARPIGD